MRILGVSKEWDKLKQPFFTTFRFPRKDKDWQVGEGVQIVLHPRSKNRKYLGIAEITNKELLIISTIVYISFCRHVTNDEAVADGFKDIYDMVAWFHKIYPQRSLEPMNKLTLKWRSRG